MRHQKKGRKLNRTASHRKALMSNLASSLVIHKKIQTTEAKSKEIAQLLPFLKGSIEGHCAVVEVPCLQ